MGAVALVAAGLTVLTVAGLVLRPSSARGIAVSAVLALVAVVGHNSVQSGIWVPAFLFCIALLTVAEFRSSGRRRLTRTVLVAIVAWWALLGIGVGIHGSYSPSRLAVYAALAIMLSFSVAETAIGLVEWSTGSPVIWSHRGGLVRMNPFTNDAIERMQGTMGHPIVYGYFLGLVCVLLWANPTALRPVPRLVLLTIVAGGLVLSGTRSAALTAVIAISIHVLTRFRLLLWIRAVGLLAALAATLVLVDTGLRSLVERTVDSGSWVQRIGSLQAVPALLSRPPAEAWWGLGFGSEVSLYDRGYLSSPYGLAVVDNFVVYVLGTMGIAGIAATLILVAIAFAATDRAGRSLILYSVGMFLSFDVVVWLFTGILLFVVLALPRGVRARVDPGGSPGREANVSVVLDAAAAPPTGPMDGADGTDEPTHAPAPPTHVGDGERQPVHPGVDGVLPEHLTRRQRRESQQGGPLPEVARVEERQKSTRERIAEARPDGPFVRHLPPLDGS